MTPTIDGAHPWERDNPEAQLKEEVAAYRRFLDRGGSKGSQAGRLRRERVGALVAEVKNFRARSLRIDDAAEAEALAHIDVFGEGE